MKHSSILLPVFLLIASFAFSQESPISAFSVRGGIATIQGETTSKKVLGSAGFEVGLEYTYFLRNKRFSLAATVCHSEIEADMSFVTPALNPKVKTQINQTVFALGFKHILNPAINEASPYPGQILPFIGISAGVISTQKDEVIDMNSLGGYTLYPENTIHFVVSAEFGLSMVLSNHWAITTYVGCRTSQTDSWDTLSGSGDGTDWIIHAGLGLAYFF